MKQYILLLLLFAFVAYASAQIPNASFEVWDTVGTYTTPDGWDNMNSTTTNMSVYTCTPGPGGTMGHSYLKLITHNVSAMGLIPGIASPGVLNKFDKKHPHPQSGFPYTQRPAYLSGMWQYMASLTTDQGYISVMLSHWDSTAQVRDTIGYTMYQLPGMEMQWVPFNIPITYMSAAEPDSAMIVLSASGTDLTAGSYLYVDQLSLTNAMLTGIDEPNTIEAGIELFPNPASDRFTIRILSPTAEIQNIQLLDMTGRMILDKNGNNTTSCILSTDGISIGSYIVRLQTNEGVSCRKVVIE